jgi:hypothetical protein
MKWFVWFFLVLIIVFIVSKWKLAIGYFKTVINKITKQFRRIILHCITSTMRLLRRIHEKLTTRDYSNEGYFPLIPSENADQDGIYESRLLSGLGNPNVCNIALCGPYGSGKSSILRTFMKSHPEYRYLNVSLVAINKEDVKNNASLGTESPGNKNDINLWTRALSEEIEYSEIATI